MVLAQGNEACLYRYQQSVFDSVYLDRGRKNINQCGLSSAYNMEDIANQVYSSIRGEELFPFNIPAFEEWRRREETPFIFTHKGFHLPTDRIVDYRPVPSNYTQWDDDLLALTRDYQNVRITRDFGVEQHITVNSQSGITIESRSFLCIYYRQGYGPHMISRAIGAYVYSDEDIDRLPVLIGYISDPTIDGRVRKSATFVDAFARLHDVSNEVKYPDLESAGLPDDLTHDVIMLSGVPIHEIFGHQFEEPTYPLQVGQRSLFPVGKNVQNANLILRDNPLQQVEGLDVIGSYHYDCYGRPSRETSHIVDSRVRDHLGSEYADLKNLKTYLGIEQSDFVGNARQGGDGFFPQARMSCTVLEGKEAETIDWCGKLVMVPFNGYVLDGNFFKVMSFESYLIDSEGRPQRIGPIEGSRAIYDAIIGMHVLPGKSHHMGSCAKPGALEDPSEAEVMVSFLTNHQLWEHLTLRSM